MATETTIGGGKNFQMLGNAVSDAIHAALKKGMEIDEACCCVVAVAADYARGEYGDDYLPQLAQVITRRNEMPMPESNFI
jgi:hypothetical protein